MVKREYKNLSTTIAEMKVGDELEVAGFDIIEFYKILESRFNTADKKERSNDIFYYAHHKYHYESRNTLNVPDLFSEIMTIKRLE